MVFWHGNCSYLKLLTEMETVTKEVWNERIYLD